MNAFNSSHAALIAELAAERAATQTLRDTLNDSIALCESLRAERDKQAAVIAELRDAIQEALTWRGTHTTHAKLRSALERSA